MKLNILTTAAILAITGAFMTQSAKAQFTSSNGAPTGDLILGFSSTGTGSTTNYEIDLGQFTLYTGNSQINIANVATDLSSVYGSNWDTSGTLSFAIVGAVVGTTIDNVKTGSVLVTDSSTTALAAASNTSLGTDSGKATTIYTPLADLSNVPVAGSAANSEKVAADGATGHSLSEVLSTDGFSTLIPVTGNIYLDTEDKTSNLGTGTSTINANPFSITSGGEVVYDAQTVAVPEPSTYALGVAGLVLLIALKRRQSVARL